MDTDKDSQKTLRHYWLSRASRTRQNSQHICDEAHVTQELSQTLIRECQEILNRIASPRMLTVFALVTSCVV